MFSALLALPLASSCILLFTSVLPLLPLNRRKAHRAFRVDFVVVFAVAVATSAAAAANLAIPSRRTNKSDGPLSQPNRHRKQKNINRAPSLSVGLAHKFPLQLALNTATLSWVQIRGLGHIGPNPSARAPRQTRIGRAGGLASPDPGGASPDHSHSAGRAVVREERRRGGEMDRDGDREPGDQETGPPAAFAVLSARNPPEREMEEPQGRFMQVGR